MNPQIAAPALDSDRLAAAERRLLEARITYHEALARLDRAREALIAADRMHRRAISAADGS
jgi:hypothetical protein